MSTPPPDDTAGPHLQLLHTRHVAPGAPAGGVLPASSDESALAALYDTSTAQRRSPGAYVRANMITTVDGAVRGPDERSGSINGAADFRVFRLLRALADVVLVGAGTVRAEGYDSVEVPEVLHDLRRASGRTGPLVLAVVTDSGRLPYGLDREDVVIVTGAAGAARLRSAGGRHDVITAGEATVDLGAAIQALVARGLGEILSEGGPHLLGSMFTADVIDELCLTWTPTIFGGDPLRLTGTAPVGPVDLRLEHLLRAPDDVLIGRWSVGGPAAIGR